MKWDDSERLVELVKRQVSVAHSLRCVLGDDPAGCTACVIAERIDGLKQRIAAGQRKRERHPE